MKVKTNVKAGGLSLQRCEKFVVNMKVKTNVKAGFGGLIGQ